MRRLLPEPTDDVDLDQAYALTPGPGTRVRANFVTSVDGAADVAGHSAGLSSPADRAVFSTLRGLCDVILVGAGTARHEGYGPARTSASRQDWRRSAGLAPVPPIAVVTARLDLDLATPFFTEALARPVLVTTDAAPLDRRREAARVAEVVVAGDRRVDVDLALAALSERGHRQVLCEGGPTLLSAIASADRLDELCLSLAPLLVGPATSSLLADPPTAGPWPLSLALALVLSDGATLFLRYVRSQG